MKKSLTTLANIVVDFCCCFRSSSLFFCVSFFGIYEKRFRSIHIEFLSIVLCRIGFSFSLPLSLSLSLYLDTISCFEVCFAQRQYTAGHLTLLSHISAAYGNFYPHRDIIVKYETQCFLKFILLCNRINMWLTAD